MAPFADVLSVASSEGWTHDVDATASGPQSMLRWFGHVERMEGDKLVKRVVRSRVGDVKP